MTFEQMDLSELPSHYRFIKLVDDEMFRWEAYTPTTIEKDMPFARDWWKYVHWIPKLKKDFYKDVITAGDWMTSVEDKCIALGMDLVWFKREYKELWKRMEWMRLNAGQNYIGEVK